MISSPPKRTAPLRGETIPRIVFSVVDLPGRVAAEQADELALADDEVDALEDVDLAVVGVDGLQLEQRRRGSDGHFVAAAFVPR